jgi:hypothetical protein
LLALMLALWGCGSPTPTPTHLPIPTTDALPSAPTATTDRSPLPTPSATAPPIPTATAEASPLPTPTQAAASPADLAFDGESAYEFVLAQDALGPRPTGSEAGWATGDYLMEQLEGMGWEAVAHEFTFRGVKGRNVIGKRGGGTPTELSTSPVAMLGAHYDTRPYADHNPQGERDQWIMGANDGGSGVAVLLELARVLEVEKTGHEIWLAFFDAEDRGDLDGWPFSVGAGMLAQDLAAERLPQLPALPEFVVVVDMVGDAEQLLPYEAHSTAALNERIWSLAAQLGYDDVFVPRVKYAIIDDHRPFLEIGIPAIDIIDFDYPYWHTTQDTVDKVVPASLERVGRTLELFLETGASW